MIVIVLLYASNLFLKFIRDLEQKSSEQGDGYTVQDTNKNPILKKYAYAHFLCYKAEILVQLYKPSCPVVEVGVALKRNDTDTNFTTGLSRSENDIE